VDQGSRHFQAVRGRPALLERLVAYVKQWRVRAVVVDASGVGEGLADALMQRLGPEKVFPFNFARNHNKAGLGNQFLALVETGRFRYFEEGAGAEDEGGPPGSDAWWFFTQCRLCGYELGPGRSIEQGLKWRVNPGATVLLNGEATAVHDDRLLSAALAAEVDRLYRLYGQNLDHLVEFMERYREETGRHPDRLLGEANGAPMARLQAGMERIRREIEAGMESRYGRTAARAPRLSIWSIT
jgi:hypothetical protein